MGVEVSRTMNKEKEFGSFDVGIKNYFYAIASYLHSLRFSQNCSFHSRVQQDKKN